MLTRWIGDLDPDKGCYGRGFARVILKRALSNVLSLKIPPPKGRFSALLAFDWYRRQKIACRTLSISEDLEATALSACSCTAMVDLQEHV